jgi:tRNA threonylcarbamoyladenosine biosynthesis protein TsaB
MILAIDTATRWLGVALHNGSTVLAEVGWRCMNNHTIELTPTVHDLLQGASLATADLNGIAVAIGPGSYTGLRVGVALAKGMALANQIPLMGVSTLDIVAAGIGPQASKLLVAAEAGRTRVVTAVYTWEVGAGWVTEETPIISTWEERLGTLEERTLFAGEIDPVAAKKIRNYGHDYRVVPPASSVRRAGYLAEIGWRRLHRHQVDDAGALAPIYLRDPAGN